LDSLKKNQNLPKCVFWLLCFLWKGYICTN
jgi:hypothetical protein